MNGTYGIDQYLVRYECIDPRRLASDLGKSERWVKARITRLKNCGAWEIIKNKQAADDAFSATYFQALKQEHFIDVNELDLARATKALGKIKASEVTW